MARFLKTKSVYYKDVNLIASKGRVVSRKDVPEEKQRIFVAPMAAVVGELFASTAIKLGICVILPRFCPVWEQVSTYKRVLNTLPCSENAHLLWCAIGLKEPERIKALAEAGCENFVLDVANGHSTTTLRFLREFLLKYRPLSVMAGNIHTSSGLALLNQSLLPTELEPTGPPLDVFARIGIGNGAACLTSKESTGYGRGQISEILECSEYKTETGCITNLVADGGIRHGADAAKAFAAGASAVMLGSYFARAKEAETHISGDGTYWGGASLKQQKLYGGVKRPAEGTVLEIKSELLPLEELVNNLWMNIASAVSYSGKQTLAEFIGNGVFELKYGA